MAVTLNASASAGLVATADTSTILQLQTGGTTAVTVDASQNVGIGTASPIRPLQVGAYGSGNGEIALGASTTGYNSILFGDSATDFYQGYVQYQHNGDFMVFATAATERARFNSTGAFVLAGGTTTANGIGITFPATQSASSNANTLDDYEEGTWTPSPTGVTVNSGTPVYSGTYTKIGKVVYITLAQVGGDITLLGNGSSSFSGLPFTVASLSTSNALWSDGSAKTGTVYAYEGSTVVYVLQAISTFTNLTTLRITATYQV